MGIRAIGHEIREMSSREYGLQLALYTLIFLVLGFLSLGLGVYMDSQAAFPRAEHVAGSLFHDIGIAFLVGIILMWTLERTNKARVQAEVHEYIGAVGENFLKAVYGKELPQEMFEVIRSSLLNENFVRSTYNINVNISDFDDDYVTRAPASIRELLGRFRKQAAAGGVSTKDLVVFKSANYYEVKNVSRTPSTYLINFEIARPFGGSYKGLCGITSVRVDGREMVPSGLLDDGPEADGDPTLLRFSRETVVDPGQSIQVQVEAYSLRRNDDKEQWQTLRPCRAMNVSAEDENGNKDVTISLDAPMLGGTPAFAKKNPGTNKASLAVREYLLPYQGVTISWTPCRDDQAHRQTYHSGKEKSGA